MKRRSFLRLLVAIGAAPAAAVTASRNTTKRWVSRPDPDWRRPRWTADEIAAPDFDIEAEIWWDASQAFAEAEDKAMRESIRLLRRRS